MISHLIIKINKLKFRMYKRLVSTYESGSLRRFKYGRVDNVRSATPEVLAWVKIMDDHKFWKDDKFRAFKKAMEKQSFVIKENITGYGIDNHLCALSTMSNVAAERGEIPAQYDVFKDKLWINTMRFPLSTSQVCFISSSFLKQ